MSKFLDFLAKAIMFILLCTALGVMAWIIFSEPIFALIIFSALAAIWAVDRLR